ncbi:MAG: tetratricopeptide repeat protein [Verrucomicrobiota bacterium]
MKYWALAGCLWLAVQASAASGLSEAEALCRSRRFAEAEAVYHQLDAGGAPRAAVAYGLGKIAIFRGDYVAAVRLLERAVAMAPDHSDYFLWLGNSYAWAASTAPLGGKMELGRKCLAAYRRALELNPDNVPAHLSLMNFYRHVPAVLGGGMQKAQAEAEEIGRRDAARGAYARAVLYAHEKQYPRAWVTLEALLHQSPDHYAANLLYGRLALVTGTRTAEGEACLRRCLEGCPSEDDEGQDTVRWCLGQLAENRHEVAAARRVYEDCLQANPTFGPALDGLARLHPAGPETTAVTSVQAKTGTSRLMAADPRPGQGE